MTDKDFKKVELLSPVGTKEALTAALNGGCDAVYFGGAAFNARQYASDFSDKEIKEIIDCCHMRGVKVRITLNILYKNTEINDVLRFVSRLYEYGADALIIQDIGIFNIIKNNFPGINLHASTQMTVHNKSGAEFLRFLGFNRVVLSRELSLEEIKEIRRATDIEIEAFIHGAICVSYSGRCYMSSVIGERSGNRGRCAQPCRMKYRLMKKGEIKPVKEGYLLSPKDMQALPIIDRLMESGIDTFKIEGRMKSPEYVGLVTKNYRKYIDDYYCNKLEVEKEDLDELTQIFNRGGSSSKGYYDSYAGLDMLSLSPKSSGIRLGVVEEYNAKKHKCVIRLENNGVLCGDGIEIWTRKEPHTGTNISQNAKKGEKITVNISGEIRKGDLVYKSFDKGLDNKLKKTYEKNTRQQTIKAEVKAKKGEKLWLRLSLGDIADVELSGETVVRADNAPLTKERLMEQLCKTGGTPFKLSFSSAEVDNDIYIPMGAVNKLRRNAIEVFSQKLVGYYEREKIDFKYNFRALNKAKKPKLTAAVNTVGQFNACLKAGVSRIYFEPYKCFTDNINKFAEQCHKNEIEIFAALPWVERDIYEKDTQKLFNKFEKSDIDGYLIRNYGIIKTDKLKAADFTFNIFNSASAEILSKYFDSLCLSPELNASELENVAEKKSEIYVYGRLPLMTTHQCPVGLHCAGKKNGRFCNMRNNTAAFFLRDRKNVDFPILTDCGRCYGIILNSAPVFVLNKLNEIKKLGAEYLRLSFTDESEELAEEIARGYSYMLSNDRASNEINSLIGKMSEKTGITNGHFFRGVL